MLPPMLTANYDFACPCHICPIHYYTAKHPLPEDGISLQALKTERQCIEVGHFDAAIKYLRDSGEHELATQLAASYSAYKANSTAAAAAAAIDCTTAGTGDTTDTLAAVQTTIAHTKQFVAHYKAARVVLFFFNSGL
jgi:hypothetical protein